MFIDYVKLSMVEALRSTFDSDYSIGIKPIRIDIEYPEEEKSWPALFVQFTPNDISWAGLAPEEYREITDPEFQWEQFRRGLFTGHFDLSIFALSSGERDKLHDALISLFMFGRTHAQTVDFYETVIGHDLIGMTFQEGTLETVGTSTGLGTPWADDKITYETTVKVNVEGEFYADTFNQKLVSLEDIVVKEPIRDDEEFTDDGQGNWTELIG